MEQTDLTVSRAILGLLKEGGGSVADESSEEEPAIRNVH
jgi:hypothetical protein